MNTYDNSMAPRLRAQLERREQELRSLLQHARDTDAAPHEVEDFKDAASRESLAAVDEVQAGHASVELMKVLSAIERLDGGGYGLCLQCGAPIDLLRLEALPATPLCIACQTSNELGSTPAGRR